MKIEDRKLKKKLNFKNLVKFKKDPNPKENLALFILSDSSPKQVRS